MFLHSRRVKRNRRVFESINSGYYCVGGATSPNGTECTANHYCPQGSTTPTPCPPGSFSFATGNIALDNCEQCTPGFYCSSSGISGPCAVGFYCPAGQASATPANYTCPAGFYCTGGLGTPTECLAGMYQDEIGQSECKECPIGRYCDPVEETANLGFATGVVTPMACPTGYYCLVNTTSAGDYPCPTGTFNNQTAIQADSECTPCTGGFYCDSPGLSEPQGPCNEGFVCVSGSDTPSPTSVVGYVCPAGSYCPAQSAVETPCPAGTFSNTTGLHNVSSCEQCTPGYFCAADGELSLTAL
ncbi:hypothetical protein MAR_025231 [Mya arenaria]|uniref:Tyrosine-protein kinase ephrin type A/B receptor-like domain-containing protein n=1 Tax=Mya arenaria TaxID=6604 RepID=A0ABY7DXJ6_MYAAR|nr:hypothetical protein MAR_025231 [Mya arenaria]